MSATALERLAAELRDGGGLIAAATRHVPEDRDRVAEGDGDVPLLLEAIREGELLHYGAPRVVETGDEDLALLAGDRLYALGLARLADLGALDAGAELAGVISLAAQAIAEGDQARAEAVWTAGARAVGGGSTPEHEAAKAAWRGGRGKTH